MTSLAEASDYANPWLYQGVPFSSDHIQGSYGFVYLITNKTDNRKYVGKKLFISTRTKVVKKKKKKVKSESDWKDYYGSSIELLADVDKLGRDNFTREILHLCASKGECNYLEAAEQFGRHVLLDETYYNGQIQVRVHRSHVSKIKRPE